MDADPFLTTNRIALHRFTRHDAALLEELDSDPEVMRFISRGQPTPLPVIEEKVIPLFLSFYARSETLGYWAAVERKSGAFLGWFHFRPDRDVPGASELGYRLRRDAWGRGFATEGSIALIENGFSRTDTDLVTASTLATNTASQRVMEKAGLRFLERFVYSAEKLPEWTAAEREGVRYGLTRAAWNSAN